MKRRFFLVIPQQLLQLIERHIAPVPWDEEARELEFEAAGRCGEHRDVVGFWDGIPLTNSDVRAPAPLPRVSEADAREMGWKWNQAQIDRNLKAVEIQISYFSNVARGYAGWLVTNRDFQNEQAPLLDEWAGEIEQTGLSGVSTLITMPGPSAFPTASVSTTDRRKRFAQAVRQFLVRWRLNELTAPSVPAPAKPLMAGIFPLSISHHLQEMGGVFHIPDTYPVPSRDQLRGMLDQALHYSSEAEHLEEWGRVVRASNAAKNKIERFARIREMYHYWALLHDRHGEQLVGQVEVLQRAFAAFLSVSIDTVRRDLREIERRLGSNWPRSGRFRLV